MLKGFRQFYENSSEFASHESGLRELARLGKGHFLIAVPVDHIAARRYLNGTEGLQHVSKEMVVSPYDIENKLRTIKDALVLAVLPRRWFDRQQLERKGIAGALGEYMPLGEGWKLPANYIWGYFSKWNEINEQITEPGQFYKNPNYHGHDGLFEKWKETYQKPQPAKPIPLDIPTSRMPTPHIPQHGYHSFHGYNSFDFTHTKEN
jgi:hypothetical protein